MLLLTEQGCGGQLVGWTASGNFLPGNLGPCALPLHWHHAAEGGGAGQQVRPHSTCSQVIWGAEEKLMLGLPPGEAGFWCQGWDLGLRIL